MAYNKTTWLSGDTVTSEKLNKIEDQLENLSSSSNSSAITVVTKTSSDTNVVLDIDKFYIFPEMSALSVTVTAVGMYAFRFTSGTTATSLTVTGAIMPDGFAIETNKVYEVNIYYGYGVVNS